MRQLTRSRASFERLPHWCSTLALATLLAVSGTGCSGDAVSPGPTNGGSAGMGGSVATAGGGSGGTSAGGTSTGGTSAGGTSAGGTSAGGTSAGGAGAGAGGAGGTSIVPSGGAAGSDATGGTAGGDTIPATFDGLKSVIMMSCFGGVCHDLPEHPLQLKLDDKLYGTLTTHMTKGCGVVVKAGSPQDSALVKLLKGPCGGTDRMPLNKCTDDGDEGCVTPANIAAIEQWIAAGAPQ